MVTKTNFTTNETLPLRFYLRKLEEPFGFKICPLYNEKMAREIEGIAIANGNFKSEKAIVRTVTCNIVYWTAWVYPLCTNADRFYKLAMNMQMYTVIDDHVEEVWGDFSNSVKHGMKYLKKEMWLLNSLRKDAPWYQRILGRVLLATPWMPVYVRLMFMSCKKIFEDVSPALSIRIIKAYLRYMRGTVGQVEVKDKTKSKSLDFDGYMRYREEAVGAYPCFVLIEYAYEIELSEKENANRSLQELNRLAELQIQIGNDLFSAFKEFNGEWEGFNHSIGVMVRTLNKTVQEAVDELCRTLECTQQEFMHVRDHWYASGEVISDRVRKYVTGLEYFMQGCINWERMSRRYHGVQWNNSITTGMLEWSPEGTIYTPDKVNEEAVA